MATCTNTNRSYSYSYKVLKCRCINCKKYHSEQRHKDLNAKERSRIWRLNNIERSRNNSKNYQLRNPDKVFSWQLNKYGINLDYYNNILRKQNNVCAICKLSPHGLSNSNKRLSIDHDKITGRVRGLLCGSCNVGIGHLNHSEVLLTNSINYLKGF